jgi:hypothetical protein
VAARLFAEQFCVAADQVQAKANKEISASNLQSLDDLEATYRKKNGVGYKGYVATVTETCDPENDLQLVTAVQVAPNTTEDSKLLVAVLPELKQRTGLDTLYTDGAYGGPLSDPVLRNEQVTLVQTAIAGPKSDPEKLHLADFVITQDDQGRPISMTCPQDQTVAVNLDYEATVVQPYRLCQDILGANKYQCITFVGCGMCGSILRHLQE